MKLQRKKNHGSFGKMIVEAHIDCGECIHWDVVEIDEDWCDDCWYCDCEDEICRLGYELYPMECKDFVYDGD